MDDSPSYNAPHTSQLVGAIDTMMGGLEKILSGLAALREALEQPAPAAEGDPKDPANKYTVGGLEKLTPRGVEICYRLFDKGLSRYAVAQAMDISFGAATHRLDAWQKAGGLKRVRAEI